MGFLLIIDTEIEISKLSRTSNAKVIQTSRRQVGDAVIISLDGHIFIIMTKRDIENIYR